MTEPAYPKDRPPFFAHRYTRLLIKSCAAQEIGHVAFVLCVIIVHTEDAKRYTGPVSFFTGQLLPLLGLAKWEGLDAARRRAVEAGWLVYVPGEHGQRMPGLYWTAIPVRLGDLDDAPVDEPTRKHYPAKGDREGDREGDRRGDREGEHSMPLPIPIPERGRRKRRTRAQVFCAPELPELSVFWKAEHLHGDPAKFHAYYTARGWRDITDWRAAAHAWSQRETDYRPAATSTPLRADTTALNHAKKIQAEYDAAGPCPPGLAKELRRHLQKPTA